MRGAGPGLAGSISTHPLALLGNGGVNSTLVEGGQLQELIYTNVVHLRRTPGGYSPDVHTPCGSAEWRCALAVQALSSRSETGRCVIQCLGLRTPTHHHPFCCSSGRACLHSNGLQGAGEQTLFWNSPRQEHFALCSGLLKTKAGPRVGILVRPVWALQAVRKSSG